MSGYTLYHHGIKGMRWGIRRFQDKSGRLTPEGRIRYAEESDKKITVNKDGSRNIPSGFVFNRVGRSTLDINRSGALYVSHGKPDAARYIRNLGPTPLNRLLRTSAESVQHISAKKNLRMASDSQTALETANLLSKNKKLLDSFNESIFAVATTGDFDKTITQKELQAAMKNPSGKDAQKLAYGVSSFLADPKYVSEAKTVYDHFRTKGYDAIPDLHDTLSGTSSTAMIVMNPDKVELKSTTKLSKDVMKSAKQYVKSLDKLKVSDLIKD